ncbi:MAG: polysaccharide biosynthesis protein PslH [Thermoleophilaceae bacterium]|jgi:glycosyltransferase involved in cell wall biosynthesis|nr:polysaccharide biosynthesis protein PslH [Thermoleophilaceae bacterium]
MAFEPVVPARSGLPLRILHLARALSQVAEVDLVALGHQPVPRHDEPFDIRHVPLEWSSSRARLRAIREPWSVAQWHSPAMRALVRAGRWDTVQAHTLAVLPMAADAGCPVVLDAHDAWTDVTATMARTDSRRGRRVWWRLEHAKAVAAERRAARSTAAVTVPTEAEAELFEGYGARAVVVPNGVDLSATPHAPPTPEPHVVFVGYYLWRPNLEAAVELVDRVMPLLRARLPGASLRLVGRDPAPELLARAGPGVEVTGAVPDVLPHLRWAGVTVLPIRAGGGSRLKALEALAAGVPVVATPFAVNGLGLRDGEHVLLGQRPGDLADQAARVLEDRALAERLSIAGRALVERRFDWPRVARPLVELHHELAGTA